MNKKGFTLIELLVVIAIIGIIAGVIVVSMDGSSDKARDARIKSEMDNIRTRMEIIRADNAASSGSYIYTVGALTSDTEISKLVTDIEDQGGTPIIRHDSTTAYCMQVTLPSSSSSTTNFWCVDSTGYAGSNNGCSSGYTCATGD